MYRKTDFQIPFFALSLNLDVTSISWILIATVKRNFYPHYLYRGGHVYLAEEVIEHIHFDIVKAIIMFFLVLGFLKTFADNHQYTVYIPPII